MKIYLDNIPLGDVAGPSRQPGEFFPRLVGFRVSSAGNCGTGVPWAAVEPVYIPVLRFHRQAGQVLVEINGDRPLYYVTLQARRPFISIFRFDWENESIDL